MFDSVRIDTPNFAGHESFPLRFTWLKKAYDALVRDCEYFQRPDAMVFLGVGKNMVRAIRHWALACEVVEEVAGQRGRQLRPTPYGRRLLEDDGWDPYLEDMGTIWWLHWRLVTNTHRATSWSWVFGRPRGNRFTREEIIGELVQIADYLDFKRAKRTSLRRDVNVLIRSYAGTTTRSRDSAEDMLDSPFALLELVRSSVEKGEFEIVAGRKDTLPLGIFHAAVVEYCMREDAWRRSVSLDELLYAPFSPGRTFRLSEDGFIQKVLLLDQASSGLRFDETAGLRQVFIEERPHNVLEVLNSYYTPNAKRATSE